MSAAARLLPLLDKVTRTGPGKWIACCPAHDDHHPSMGVRGLDDGRLLVHCRAGCEVESIVAAIGLELSDLFPPRPATPGGGHKPERRPWLPADVFSIARREIGIAATVAADMLADRSVSDSDFERLAEVAATLERIAEVAYAR